MVARKTFLTVDNLKASWRRVRRNKSSPGIDGVTWQQFDTYAEEFLADLQKDLAKGTYEPSPLRGTLLAKRHGGWRPIGVPTYRDRVAQRALLNVLNPLLDRELETCSFAYREGKSIFHALAKIEGYREKGLTCVLEADIDDCFESIDHDLLLACVAQYVEEKWALDLIRAWISVPTVFAGSGLTNVNPYHAARVGADANPPANPPGVYPRTRGVPQGAIISPLLCNLFLDEFDEALLKRHFALVRYADDFVVLGTKQQRVYQALEATTEALGHLDLQIEESKTRVTSFDEGFEYLGVLFVRSLALPTFRLMTTGPQGQESVRFVPGYPDVPLPRLNLAKERERRQLLRWLSRQQKVKTPTSMEVALRRAVEELEREGQREVPLWTPSAWIA